MPDAVIKFEQMLSNSDLKQMREMDTPHRIQRFLDSIPYPAGEENRSPAEVLRQRQAHCLDGGLFAATALRLIGYPPLILDIQPDPGQDDDHVLALYQEFLWKKRRIVIMNKGKNVIKGGNDEEESLVYNPDCYHVASKPFCLWG